MSLCDSDIKLGNIVLTQGESSPKYEIYSTNSLEGFTAEFRITNEKKEVIKSSALERTKEIKNNDSIYKDHLVSKLEGREYNSTDSNFNHKIELTAEEKKELSESIEFSGLCYDLEMVDTVKKKDEMTPEEEKFKVKEYQDDGTSEMMVILRKESKVGVPNIEVTITYTSIEKETSRSVKVVTDSNGEFSGSIFLGDTIKEEAGKGFVFMIPANMTEDLKEGLYVVTVTVKKTNSSDEVIFCREIIQTKLDINSRL